MQILQWGENIHKRWKIYSEVITRGGSEKVVQYHVFLKEKRDRIILQKLDPGKDLQWACIDLQRMI